MSVDDHKRKPLSLPAPVLNHAAPMMVQEESPTADDAKLPVSADEAEDQYDLDSSRAESPLLAGTSPDQPEAAPEKSWKDRIGVYGALVALIASRTVDQVLYYRIAKMYSTYTWALGAIILSAGYVMVLWPVVWYKMFVTGEITAEHRRFPHKALFIMATLDTIGSVAGIWPIPYIPSSMVNVLSNAVLPMTMIAAILFLRTRYRWTHYVGATLVVLGVVVRLVPAFVSHSSAAEEKMVLPGVWIPVYILALVPSALSNVYKEGGLKNIVSDVWHVNAWIGIYQLLLGALTIPTVFIPWPGADRIAPDELGQYLKDASTCFFLGRNPRPGSPDQCEGIFWLFLVYLAFNIAFNQLMLYVFKNGSSVLAVISSTARLPLVDFLLLWGFLAGAARITSITVFDVMALLLIIFGIILYKWKKEKQRKRTSETVKPNPSIQDSRLNMNRLSFRRPSFLSRNYSPAFPKRM